MYCRLLTSNNRLRFIRPLVLGDYPPYKFYIVIPDGCDVHNYATSTSEGIVGRSLYKFYIFILDGKDMTSTTNIVKKVAGGRPLYKFYIFILDGKLTITSYTTSTSVGIAHGGRV